MNIHRIIGVVDVNNIRSINLMKKLKMNKEAHFIKSYFDERLQEWKDEFVFSKLNLTKIV